MAVPPRWGYLTTEDGVRLFYEARGEGPQAVLVPNGLYLLNDLEALARDRLLIFYDLRNRGRSDVSDTARRKGAFPTTFSIWTPSAGTSAWRRRP